MEQSLIHRGFFPHYPKSPFWKTSSQREEGLEATNECNVGGPKGKGTIFRKRRPKVSDASEAAFR